MKRTTQSTSTTVNRATTNSLIVENTAVTLRRMLDESRIDDPSAYTLKGGRFSNMSTIDTDVLMQKLVIYLSAHERAVFDHAYKLGKGSK